MKTLVFRQFRRTRCVGMACLLGLLSTTSQAEMAWQSMGPMAASASGGTHLLGLESGGPLSSLVAQARSQSYETSSGAPVDMDRWYHTGWRDMRMTWLTQLSASSGLIWGMGTGERGPKYSIAPSLKLGYLQRWQWAHESHLSFRASVVLGGRLREKACQADYGDVGGMQQVNCRLAAGTLEPSSTLKYLWNEAPRDRLEIQLMYRHTF